MNARQAAKTVKQVAYEFEHQFDMGLDVANRQTFETYSRYVIDLKSDPDREGGCKHNTIVLYERLRRNLLPYIGNVPIKDISTQRLNALYDELSRMKVKRGQKMKDGTVRVTEGDKCISPKTVREYYSFISAVLEQAVQDRIIAINPAHASKPPKKKKPNVRAFEPSDIQAIRTAALKIPLKWQIMIDLFLVSGCRRGELAGLEWERVDFTKNQIEISKEVCYTSERGIYIDTPKTSSSVRFIALPKETMDKLKAFRREQMELRLLLGDRWTESDFVFTASEGGPINPTYITSYLRKFSDRNGLPHINPHAFRHTAASLLIASGNDVVAVSDMLGHAEVSTTLNIYSHAIEAARQRTAETMSNILEETKPATSA